MMETWKGFKDFIISDKISENAYITSFYLKPLEDDKERLPDYLPGQFISIRVPKGGGGYSIPRQYTLSLPSNGTYYRISVKREEEGHISKLLCDTVQVGDRVQISAPAGKFVLDEGHEPIVLIGGGIGITPMLTMAYEAKAKKRKAHLIYSVPYFDYYAFDKEIKELTQGDTTIELTRVYTRPRIEDQLQHKYDVKGRLTKEWLQENTPSQAKFYICGPIAFMKNIYHHLITIGIAKENIYYEMFTPGEDITKL